MTGGSDLDVLLVSCDISPWAEAQRAALALEFEALHCSVDVASWDDDRDWAAASGLVITSPFNAAPRYSEFLGWLDARSAQGVVINDAQLLAAGSHRRYLFDVLAAGIPTVPTRQVAQHAPWQFQRAVLRRFDRRVVMKPAVASSLFGYATLEADSELAQAHLEAITLLGDVVIQPYITTVDTVGVSKVVILGGEISHAVRTIGDTTVDHTIQPEEREVILAALDILPVAPIAACIELVWIGDDPALLSFDVVGPNLHAEAGSPALRQFARLALNAIHAPRIGGIVGA